MSARKRPVGGGGVGNPNSLANLRPNPENLRPGAGPKWTPGSTPALRHGLRSRAPSQAVIDPVLDQVIADLETRVPVRDADGQVPEWLRELCWSASIKKLQTTRCARYIAQHGEVDERGAWRPENDALVKAAEGYERSLDRLAMTVPAYARAGLDAAKTLDLATIMSEPDDDRRRAMAAEAGISHLFAEEGE